MTKKRTDADYAALFEAVCTLRDWYEEIVEELAAKGQSWKSLDETLRAAERVQE